MIAMSGPALAANAPNEIRAQAVAFYRWYLDHADDRSVPTEQSASKAFLTTSYRKRLDATYRANGFAEDADPFLNVQDYDAANWKAHVVADQPTGLSTDPRLVVHLGTGREAAQVCVHFRRDGGIWKIAQVDQADDSHTPADCQTKN